MHCTGHATVASLRARGGIGALNVSHIANPTLEFATPSRKIEFYSGARRSASVLPPLPTHGVAAPGRRRAAYLLSLAQGRTMTHFHSFYNNGRELPTLAKRESEPALWISPSDADRRGKLIHGAAIRMFNMRGEAGADAPTSHRQDTGAARCGCATAGRASTR